MPTADTLPPARVTFARKSFCFTGRFVCGSVSALEAEVFKRGGWISADVDAGLDYLVVGSIETASRALIESALRFRNAQFRVAIVSEGAWVRALVESA